MSEKNEIISFVPQLKKNNNKTHLLIAFYPVNTEYLKEKNDLNKIQTYYKILHPKTRENLIPPLPPLQFIKGDLSMNCHCIRHGIPLPTHPAIACSLFISSVPVQAVSDMFLVNLIKPKRTCRLSANCYLWYYFVRTACLHIPRYNSQIFLKEIRGVRNTPGLMLKAKLQAIFSPFRPHGADISLKRTAHCPTCYIFDIYILEGHA